MNCKICQLKPNTIKKLTSDNQSVIKIFMEAKQLYESEIEQLSADEKKNFLATYADAKGFITMPDGNKVKINFIEEFDQKLCEHLELVEPDAAQDWEGYEGELQAAQQAIKNLYLRAMERKLKLSKLAPNFKKKPKTNVKKTSKISRLKSATISKLQPKLREIIAEHVQDTAEYKELWEDLPISDQKTFLAEFGQNENFVFDGVKVETNFLDEVDEILAEVVENELPEAASDWEGEPKNAAEPEITSDKKLFESQLKVVNTAIKYATGQDKTLFETQLKVIKTALKYL